jgi:BirA family transcriptional regulator, biotin operon repressor / biotin---[acetyl-CoA-carboxylase] ligase
LPSLFAASPEFDLADSRLIDPARLAALLGPAARRFNVEALARCDSTNLQLGLAAGRGAPSGSVLVVDRQTAGRGRRGRQWLSAPADSLTFSLLWRFSAAGGWPNLSGLSLAVGLAVALACDEIGLPGLSLKWPNDLLLHKGEGWAKAGGILIELSSDAQGVGAVIGIGLNLRAPDAAGMDLPPGALAELASDADSLPDRHRILAAVLRQLLKVLDRFAVEGLSPFRSAWEARHAFAGAPVRLLPDANSGQAPRDAVCLGIDDDGALRVETAAGVERWLAGDVSLRLQ